MRAMILAAGRGTRMHPLTEHTPKPLLTVAGKPLIVYHLEALKWAGVTDVVINISHLGEKIIHTLGNGQAWGVNIQYSYEVELLETGGGIVQALPLLGDDPFLVISGDIYTKYEYKRLCDKVKELHGLVHLVMTENPEHNPQGDYALQGSTLRVTGYNKKNFAGIGLYHPKLFHTRFPVKFPLGELLREAITQEQATGELFEGKWANVGTQAQLNQLNKECIHETS